VLPLRLCHFQVVEVGALDGTFTMKVAQLPNVVSVLSFEPTPGRAAEIRARIDSQLDKATAAKITVRSDAVSNYTGTAKFYTSNGVFNGAVNSLGMSWT
jgi:FkbM family methyltransferase